MGCCATHEPRGGMLARHPEARTVVVKVHLLKAPAQVVRGSGSAPFPRLLMVGDIAGLPEGG